MLKPKQRICSNCGQLKYIWARGKCKQCSSKGSSLKKTKLKTKAPPTNVYQGKQLLTHTAMYLELFGYDVNEEYFPSEISEAPANDVHHIIRRGLVGEAANHPLNLMALTREEHDEYGDVSEAVDYLIKIHLLFCKNRGVDVRRHLDTIPPALDRIKKIGIKLFK